MKQISSIWSLEESRSSIGNCKNKKETKKKKCVINTKWNNVMDQPVEAAN